MWLIYIALEPFLRRRWPHRIIAWNRLLTGNFRDPLVGRDILIGALAGVVLLLNSYLLHISSKWLGKAPEMPIPVPLEAMLGARGISIFFSAQLISSLVYAAVYMLLFLLLSIILRKEWLAIGMVWLLLVAFEGLASANLSTGLLHAGLGAAGVLFILVRFGFLTFIFTQFFILLAILYPLTSDPSAWYAGNALFALALGLAVAIYGFYISLAGQPLFRGCLLQD